MNRILILLVLFWSQSSFAQVAVNVSNSLGFNVALYDSETFIVPEGKSLIIKSVFFQNPSGFGELRVNSKVVLRSSVFDVFQNISVYAGPADLISFVGPQNSISINGILLSNETTTLHDEELLQSGFRVLQSDISGQSVILERSGCFEPQMFYLTNIEGKELTSFLVKDSRYMLDCSQFANGTYILGNGREAVKFNILK